MARRHVGTATVLALLLLVACGDDTPSTGSVAGVTDPAATSTTGPDAVTAPTDAAPGTDGSPTPTDVTTTAEPTPTAAGATTTEASTTAAESTTDVRIYFARDERLAITRRSVPGADVVGEALRALIDGPTADDSAAGFITLVPEGTSLRGVAIDDGVATVDLTRAFEAGGGSMSMQARVAQVVFTATQFADVDAVRFWLDGEPIEFLGGEGIVVDEPWTRADTARELTGGILFEQPAPGATTASPIVVTGEGDVFEGDFPLWVERDGLRLGDVQVVPAGAWGEWADFSTTVTVGAAPGPLDLVAVDDGGCGPPECAVPSPIVVPITLGG